MILVGQTKNCHCHCYCFVELPYPVPKRLVKSQIKFEFHILIGIDSELNKPEFLSFILNQTIQSQRLDLFITWCR